VACSWIFHPLSVLVSVTSPEARGASSVPRSDAEYSTGLLPLTTLKPIARPMASTTAAAPPTMAYRIPRDRRWVLLSAMAATICS
jgi:hypothetical protein